ncbi:hypothetical protein CANINC_000530 [Pichia inconspicua]|uniref:Vacuolar protein sorting-associated protein n=1 Tax=Pichia inconspicua TaxID=52247 RepID=A0A4T0X7B7_9ASCO|nr:hypothetical protein CANINC_000530 [[Candida] inconspicua]
MLESIVANILNRSLGAYVENFDPNQLNIGIWSGDVTLSNLKLKPESLDKLELPLELKCGNLGNLTMQIPWSNLKGKPVKVLIQDCYLLITAKLPNSYDKSEEIQKELRIKRQKLDNLEALSQQSTDLTTSDPNEALKNQSFTDSLISKIIDNLQITIKNIHIRYEDFDCYTKSPYSFGITLEELSAVSTDENWIQNFIEQVTTMSRKLMLLKSLTIYMDTSLNGQSSIVSENKDQMIENLKNFINSASSNTSSIEYLLQPVSGTGHLTLNKLGATDENPHYNLNLFFDQFRMNLNRLQYCNLLDTTTQMSYIRKVMKFKKNAPNCSIEEDPYQWLHYTFKTIFDEIHEKNYKKTWDYMKKRRDQRKAYIPLWKKHLVDPNSLTPEEKRQLDQLEIDCDYDDLKFYRSLAKIQYTKEFKSLPRKQEPQQKGWFSSWWSGNSNDDESNLKKNELQDSNTPLQITEEQLNEFYEAIEFDDSKILSDSLDIPRERIQLAIDCKLNTGSFVIRNEKDSNSLAEFISQGCHMEFLQRKDSFFAGFKLSKFSVEDGATDILYKHIVSVKQVTTDSESDVIFSDDPFFQVSFEKNPLNESADSELIVKLSSMTIFHNTKFLESIYQFFKPPQGHTDTIGNLMNAAESTIQDFTKQTKIGLQYAFEEHKTMNCQMDLQAPLIILPIDPTKWDSPVGILDAGHISIISDLIPKSKYQEIKDEQKDSYTEEDWKKLNSYMFDKYTLSLHDAQIFIGPDIKSTIEQLHTDGEKTALILDHLDMNFLIELSIIPSFYELPKMKIGGDIPRFRAMLSDYQYKIFMDLLSVSIPDFEDHVDTKIDDNYKLFQGNDDSSIDIFSDAQTYLTNPDTTEISTNDIDLVKLINTPDSPILKQHEIQFNFTIDLITLSLKRCSNTSTFESETLVDLIGEKLDLSMFTTLKQIQVDLKLSDISVNDHIETSQLNEFKKLVGSNRKANHSDDNLFVVSYTRTLRYANFKGESIECFDQDIKLDISDFQVVLTRKSILTLLNYSLNTFTDPMAPEIPSDKLRHNDEQNINAPAHINLDVNMKSISLILNDDGIKLATLTLAKAYVSLFMLPDSMRLTSKIGGLKLVDNDIHDGRQLISIQGDDLADIHYETYDLETNTLPYTSLVKFESRSMVFNVFEDSFSRIYGFINQFQRMKYIYDAARDAALDQANNVESPDKIKFDVLVRAPIFIFPQPVDPANDVYDFITVNLGEIHTSNNFMEKEGNFFNIIKAGLSNTKILSSFVVGDERKRQDLEIIDKLDINFDIDYYEGDASKLDRSKIVIDGNLQGNEIKLTELQAYTMLQISQTIPRILQDSGVENEDIEDIQNDATNANMLIMKGKSPEKNVLLTKEDSDKLLTQDGDNMTIELNFNIPILCLIIYSDTVNTIDITSHQLSQFILNDLAVSLKMEENGDYNSDVQIKSFVVKDVRESKSNVFTDIIPGVEDNEHQFVAKITEVNKKTTVDLTIDRPSVILAMDYLFALKAFADFVTREPKSITHQHLTPRNIDETLDNHLDKYYDDENDQNQQSIPINYIINIIDPAVLLLANPESKESDAIVLRITQLLLCISEVKKINAFGIGMFLKNMATESKLRILDDFSFDFVMDDRGSNKTNFLTGISSNIQPLLLRLSLRDVYLAIEIFNKASEMYNAASTDASDRIEPIKDVVSLADNISHKISEYAPSIISSVSKGSNRLVQQLKEPLIILKAERLKIKFEGLRVVVIGDVHELPILDFDVEAFEINAKNWSTELEADTQIKTLINIFNYSLSQWEPLLEPWLFSVLIEKSADGKMAINVVSREIAEFSITSRSIATVSHFANLLTERSELKERGQDSPFMIINETGYDLNIWIDDGSDERKQLTTVKFQESIPWSFEDWRQVREKLEINTNLNFIGVEFIDAIYQPVRQISLKSEGDEVFMLEPKLFDSYHNRLACEIKLGEDKVKNVTLRSTVSIQNNTPTAIHVGAGNYNGEFVVDREIIIPSGAKQAIPIDYVYTGTFAVRPETQTELFDWSIAKLQGADQIVDLNWQRIRDDDIILECPKLNDTNGPADYYYYKIHAEYDHKDALNRLYPNMNIMISPPLVLENLLPYDINWKLFQKGPRKWTDVLHQGEKCPIHVVDMNFSVILKMEILDSKYGISGASIINTPTTMTTVDEEINLKSSDGQRLNLRLFYSHDPKYGTKVSVYSPYLFVNRTGLDLQVIDHFNTITMKSKKESADVHPEMFSFSMENDAFAFIRGNLAANTIRVKIGDSHPSETFSIDKIGQSFEVSAALKVRNFENDIGVHITEGTGKYNLTKVISLQPRYIIRNDLDLPVFIGLVGSSKTIRISDGDVSPVYEMPSFGDKQLKIGFREGEENMSAAFVVNNIGEVYLRVKKLTSNAHMLLRVVISSENASIFVNIIDAKNLWPYSIRNFSDEEFFIYQSDPNIDKEGNKIIEDAVFKPIFYRIPPKSVMPYAWDYPAAEVKELVLRCGNRERYVQLAEIGSLMPMRVKRGENTQIFDLNVVADGPVQALMISSYDPKTSMYQLRNSRSDTSMNNSNTNVSTNTAVKDDFETNIKDENYFFNFVLNFEGLGVSLINTKDGKNEELCYNMIRGIELRYNESEIYQTASIKLKWVQIDNQLYSCIFPVVLFPTVLQNNKYDLNRHPVFSSSLARLKDDAHGVTYIKFATMLLQELSIQVDEDFLWALLDFSKIPGAAWSSDALEDQLWDKNMEIPEPPTIRSMNDLYFEALHLQPLQFNISFVRTEKVGAEDTMSSQNALSLATDILTMAIGNINDAPVRLSALMLENIRTPVPYLLQNITEHYKQAFLYQLYKVLGSADVLGNPVGLFTNISSGVMDIFYEPYQGYIMTDRPQELGIGLAKGSLSFLKKSVFGVSDSVSRFTDSVAKSLTVASMDKNFQERRRLQRQQRNFVNNNAVDGFSRGATSLFTGISSGITGLALAPMEGATREGASGFFKGLGKGLIGLPTKTATGVLDMANNISESIRNTTTAFDNRAVEKVRLPRYIPKDGSVIAYDKRKAQGQYWMKKFWADDDYIGHIKIQGERICLVTYARIAIINLGLNTVEGEIGLSDVINITLEKAGLRIKCKNGSSKLIEINDRVVKKELYGFIAVAVGEYNKNCIVAL